MYPVHVSYRFLLPAIGLFFVIASCKPHQDVAQFRSDPSHSGVYETTPLESYHGVLWNFQTQGIVYSSPALSDGVIYVGSADSNLYAIDERTGSLNWKFKTGGPVHSSPAVADQTVFFGSGDGLFYALDASTGVQKWTFKTQGERRFQAPGLHGLQPKSQVIVDDWDMFLSSPVVTDGMVIFGSGDGNVYALDLVNGKKRWQFATGGVVHASPAVRYGNVYIGSWDTHFYALDLQTGREKWRFKTGVDTVYYNQTGIQSSAAVVDSTVYFGCRDARLYAVDAFTGKEKWNFYANMSWIISSPAVHEGKVYFGTSDSHRFLTLDARTGKVLKDSDTGMFIFSSPSIAGSYVYVGTFGGKVLAFDSSGTKKEWEFMTEAATKDAQDVLTGEGTMNPAVFSSPRFEDAPATYARIVSVGSILSSPVVADGKLYFGSTDGNVYAIH